jgi:Fic family protein
MTVPWPPITYEQHPWVPSTGVPRTQQRKHAGVYDAAVVPAIAAAPLPPLNAALVALLDEATAEIARFDAEHGADIAPFAPLLLRSESAASSKIENLTASAKSIALAELGDPSKHNAAIIVANTRAMEAAVALADRLDDAAILDMHRVLLEATVPRWAGKWRDQQVWIGGSDYGPHNAQFVAPHHQHIPTAVQDLVAFMQRDDVPVLTLAALAHAQFETIHPFPDGNGRVGRALIHALLRAKGLTREVTVPVSAGLLTHTQSYFDGLTDYRRGEIEPIVELIADAAFRAVANGRELIVDLQAIRAEWDDLIRVRRGASAWRVADVLISQPVIDSPLLQRELGIAATNANSAIDHLVEVGILSKVSGNHRNRKWASNDVLHALDDFADRTGRRN